MSPKLKKSVVSALILTILYIAIPFPLMSIWRRLQVLGLISRLI